MRRLFSLNFLNFFEDFFFHQKDKDGENLIFFVYSSNLIGSWMLNIHKESVETTAIMKVFIY